ncbi:hypothetical protein [uncultured Microbacterium sp.]|uniref:hypothetical protein n=1 Tax=uncultured Microbacterium sp. TaxID=191216 RepID=UPI0025EA49CF|nr:hypothetical protein [uncultured Microbacterium sp.]
MLGLWSHDAITGNERAQVTAKAVEQGTSWSMNISGTGECSFVFAVEDTEDGLTLEKIRELFTPNSTHLSLRWGPTAVLGAWKVEDWDFGGDESTVIVTGVEIRNETNWRMTYGVSLFESGTLTVTNRSHQGAVRAILARFMQWSPEWGYAIDLPADGAGTFSQTWEFWKKLTIADLLKQIEDEGYEILFRPYLTAGRQLRFEVLVAPRVSIGTSYFHLQAADSPLSGVRYKESGVEQLTGGQGTGTGSGQDQPVAWAGGPPYLIPIRDAQRQFPDLEGARLQAATDAWFAENRYVQTQWTVKTYTASEEYPASNAAVGRGWQLESAGHRVFPNGRHGVRVISASGSWSNQIGVEVQRGS